MGKLFLEIDVILVGEELVEPRLLKVDGGPDGKGEGIRDCLQDIRRDELGAGRNAGLRQHNVQRLGLVRELVGGFAGRITPPTSCRGRS